MPKRQWLGRRQIRRPSAAAPDRLAPMPRRARLGAQQNVLPKCGTFRRGTFSLFPARSPTPRTGQMAPCKAGNATSHLTPTRYSTTTLPARGDQRRCDKMLHQPGPASLPVSAVGTGGRATAAANTTRPGGNKQTAAKASHTTIFLVQFCAARPRDGRPYYDPLRRREG
jgi:hypothetical protein